jgi:hypothetical protein
MSEKLRLHEKLRQTLTFLEVSSKAYDAGIEFEALRIAVCLRVLFYKPDTQRKNRAVPLVEHLNMEACDMLTSNTGAIPPMGYLDLILDLGSPMPVKAKPKLKAEFNLTKLCEWWEKEVVFLFKETGEVFHRKDVVLTAANKDGGAHVDSRVDAFYANLAQGEFSLGIDGKNLVYAGAAPFDTSKLQHGQNFHYALLRQFAFEVLATAQHFRWAEQKSAR